MSAALPSSTQDQSPVRSPARSSAAAASAMLSRVSLPAAIRVAMSKPKPPLALIAGATASGKSALALALAERTGGIIVNADSAQLYRDLSTYGSETAEARQDLRSYVTSIVTDEWPLLAKGDPSPATEDALFTLFDSIGRIRPADGRDSAIFAEVFSNLNRLVELRRDRLIHSRSGMPLILWIVGLVGSVLIVAYTATFPQTRTNRMMIAGISVALGLVFLFILIVDRPFTGAYQVENDELTELPAKFDLLDRLGAEAAAGPGRAR